MMKAFVCLSLLLTITISKTFSQSSTAAPHLAHNNVRTTDTFMKFAALPEAGFNFDYLIFLPKGTPVNATSYLMVETNNSGLNDTVAHHLKGALHAAANGVASYVARRLHLPLLVPVFPRSATHWTYYTHALDRDVLLTKEFGIERLDLQLLAMIDDAKKQLAQLQYPIKDQFFMTGFSASGTFANRFSMLHGGKIKALAAGGINAIAILPVSEIDGQKMSYPLGIADLQQITGKDVDVKAFKNLPQLLYMGALDDNDAAAFDDAYSAEERAQIYNLMGKELIPQRWAFMQKVYEQNGVQAEFRTYTHMGHGTDLKINNDLVEFFRKHLDETPKSTLEKKSVQKKKENFSLYKK